MAKTHKLNISLTELLTWAKGQEIDTSDIGAVKDAYRKMQDEKEDKGTARVYNKKNVTLYVHLPNGETLHFFDLANSRSGLLAKAYEEATKSIAEIYKGKRGVSHVAMLEKVSVSWGETFNLSEEIAKTTI